MTINPTLKKIFIGTLSVTGVFAIGTIFGLIISAEEIQEHHINNLLKIACERELPRSHNCIIIAVPEVPSEGVIDGQ